MCNPDYRHALLAVELANRGQHVGAARGVQHGGGLIQNHDLRLHGQYAGHSHPLLLTAAEHVRGEGSALGHAHGGQGRVDAGDHVLVRHAQVFQAEGHVLAHHVGHNLVVRVLKHHARMPPDVPYLLVLRGVQTADQHAAFRRQVEGVHQLGQRALAASVVPQYRHKRALFHVQAHMVYGSHIILVILVADVFDLHGIEIAFVWHIPLHGSFMLGGETGPARSAGRGRYPWPSARR